MKAVKRVIAVFLAVLLFSGTLAFAEDEIDIGNPNFEDVLSEQDYNLTYNPERYEHSFKLGQVMVAFKHGAVITEGFEKIFPELDIKSVKIVTPGGYTQQGERELVLIYLNEETREAVIEAVGYIKNNPLVYLTEPNYTFSAPDIVIVDPPSPGDIIIDVGEPDFDDVLSDEEYAEIYNPERYENPFEPGQIVVTFKLGTRITNMINVLFNELKIQRITITAESANSESGVPEVREVILISLFDKSPEAVFEAIEYIRSNPVVYSAEPNYTNVSPKPGDITGDSFVTNSDLILEARYLVHLVTFDETQLKAADFNGDGTVNNADLVMIAREVVS